MDLIFTRPNMEDAGVLHNYEFDLAFGSDENNFECVVDKNDHCCDFGSFLYFEGTEYGGIIDGIEIKNSTMEVVYSGRTWHGILNSKVIEPDSGQAYLTVTGEANEIIASLLSRLGLTDLFEASTEDSGLNVSSYKMNRYISGYDGIRKMLKTVGGKLIFTFRDGKVLLTAAKVHDYSQDEELDSDMICLDVRQTANTVNHLICLGSGNLEDRMVIHLYADENGSISQTQTFSGLAECVAVFDYGNAEDEADLLKQGTDRLKELMQQDNLAVDVNDVNDPYDIGDIVGASDNITNIRIAVPVTKKIVSIKNGLVTIDIKTDNANVSAQPTSDYSGGSGTPGADGQDGKDGEDGKDGISCTHSWNGTVLTVTSASGTSSADLKGDKGDKGDKGEQGIQGIQGIQGEKGDTGAQGIQGEKGEKGDKGDKGDTGTFDASMLENYSPLSHEHDAGDITSGTLPVIRGGTGVTALAGSSGLLKQLFPSSIASGSIPLLGSGWNNNGYVSTAGLRNMMGAVTKTEMNTAISDAVGSCVQLNDENGFSISSSEGETEFYPGFVRLWDSYGWSVWVGADLVDGEPMIDDDEFGALYFGTDNDSLVRLRRIANPVQWYDAANKDYVDNAVANAGGGGTAMTVAQIRAICT